MEYKNICVKFCAVSALIFAVIPVSATKAADYDNVGTASVVIDNKTGEVIESKNGGKQLPLASLTKLMTALVLLDEKIDFRKKVTMTKNDLNYVYSYVDESASTSKVNLREGDQVKVSDLWNAMLIASSNESAVALVRASGLSSDEFVKKMNKKAEALGLDETRFTEYSGIDAKNISTAKEMAIIAKEAFSKKKISSASTKSSYTMRVLNKKRSVTAVNRNNNLLSLKPKGMKIGYLTEAGSNVAISLKGKKKTGTIVVLHAGNLTARNAEVKKMKTFL